MKADGLEMALGDTQVHEYDTPVCDFQYTHSMQSRLSPMRSPGFHKRLSVGDN